ncbi:MAG: cysteine--tRNA ligase [Candidatus Paceibacterota bacterium]|jgi:cysteinyl-tRNA synthetase
MQLYNTLARAKQEFTPQKPGEVSLYTCGPTVYNYAHIGNLRTYLFEDTLKRVLFACGFKPRHVMNITDVGHLVSDADEGEDKMEKGARREGKSAWDLAKLYTEAFFADFKSLNCIRPDVVCPATEHIIEMINLVKKLEERGCAYKTSDGIYFDTAKFDGYHRLAGKSHIEGLKSGARVAFSEEKRNPSDFALWKFSPKNEQRQMEWDSPWGIGFPGWHIECSAMAMKYLGETIDIHCGGVDHVAVHHTNEIAQSEAATGKPFARYWVHGEFLITKSAEKMAKSSGEFLTLAVLKKRGFSPLDYRYFNFGAHYRTQLEFSWEGLEAAAKSRAALIENAAALSRRLGGKTAAPGPAAKTALDKFMAAASDDMNMPAAFAVVWETVRNPAVSASDKLAFLADTDKVLGLDLLAAPEQTGLEPELMALVKEREAARKAKDFAKSDVLRRQLEGKGVLVKDTPQGTVWTLKRQSV